MLTLKGFLSSVYGAPSHMMGFCKQAGSHHWLHPPSEFPIGHLQMFANSHSTVQRDHFLI